MRSPSPSDAFARKLRQDLSLPEKLVWVRIRRREPGRPIYRRQHPIRPYVLDFYRSQARLCVEIDGQGHGFGDRPARDARRDAFLESLGIKVVRIPASTVLQDPEAVVEWMLEMARERLDAAVRAPSV
jgi:very-short-patch-repair endonuclease